MSADIEPSAPDKLNATGKPSPSVVSAKFTLKSSPEPLTVSSAVTAKPLPPAPAPPLIQDGIPYLGINDIDEKGEIDLRSCRKVGNNVLEKQSSSFQIKEGDIIFGKIGTIGQPKVLPKFSNYTLSANIILIQPKSVPEFIYWALESQNILKQISNTVHTTSQPAFGMEKIRNLLIVFPGENERQTISQILNKQNSTIKEFKLNLSKLQSLKTGLMQDLLSGKVRVTEEILIN
jgi:type I restriction enzyme S subunit